MSQALVIRKTTTALALPNLITREGERTTKRFLEFFTANIRNKNTRSAYVRSVSRFLDWWVKPNKGTKSPTRISTTPHLHWTLRGFSPPVFLPL